MLKKLGVNIDHVATLRQARREFDPDPVAAAQLCANAGADSIVAHLREDKRHINEKDVRNLRKALRCRFNLEMSLNEAIIKIALSVKPDQVTFVPERREELTTEGGLDVIRQKNRIKRALKKFQAKKIDVSLFIAPDRKQIAAAKSLGVPIIELHTGEYARAKTAAAREKELKKIEKMAQYANGLGLIVSAGHGLKYDNARPIARISEIEELNIGHSIVARSLLSGLGNAVKEMLEVIR